MNISFDVIKNHYIATPDSISLRYIIIPSMIGNESFLLGSPMEGCNLAEEIYSQIKDLPNQLEKETDIADNILRYTDKNDISKKSQIFIFFSPESPELTVLDPKTQEKKSYPISFSEFRDAFIKYYESDAYKTAAKNINQY